MGQDRGRREGQTGQLSGPRHRGRGVTSLSVRSHASSSTYLPVPEGQAQQTLFPSPPTCPGVQATNESPLDASSQACPHVWRSVLIASSTMELSLHPAPSGACTEVDNGPKGPRNGEK